MATPTFPANVTGSTSTGVTSYSTGSITVNSGEALVVFIANASNTNVSSVVFNSGAQSLTLVDRQAVSTTGQCEVWRISAPSAGSGTITITQGSAVISAAIACTIANFASFGTAAKTSATASSTQSLTISSNTGDISIAGFAIKNTNGTWTADGSPVTELRTSVTSGSGTSHVRMAVCYETGAASTSPSGVTSATRDWASVGFNIVQSASGGGGSLMGGLRSGSTVGFTALVA